MTLANTEWFLEITSWTQGWTYNTFKGDLIPDGTVWSSPVWVAADGFGLEWGFADDITPSNFDPSVVSFALSCETAADLPSIDIGDVLDFTLSVPDDALVRNADGSITGDTDAASATVTVQVTDLDAQEAGDRIRLTVTASTAIRDVTFSLATFLGQFGNTTWQQYSDDLNVGGAGISQPEGQFALDTIIFQVLAAELGLPYSYSSLGINEGYRGAGLHMTTTDAVQLSDLIENAHNLWYGALGSLSRAHGYAVVALPHTIFDGGYQIASLIWDPESKSAQAAPFHLVYAGSVLDSEALSGYTARSLSSNTTLGFIDGCYVRSSPEWQKNSQSVLDVVEYKGKRRDTLADSIVRTIATDVGDSNRGLAVRSIDTSCYIVNPANPGTAFSTYGGKAAADLCNLGLMRDRRAWGPQTFDVFPHLMTDSVWQHLFGAFVMPWIGDYAHAQQTLMLFNIEEDKNLAGRDIWGTMTSCSITTDDDGHLVISPQIRPFVPAAINGITDSVTWAELDATYPAATFAEAADSLTWAKAKVSSLP